MTATATNPVMLTAKLYDARGAMKLLFGDRYAEKIKPIITQIHQLSEKWELTPIRTMLRACDEMEKQGASGVDLGMVIAAYVEDVEGTFRKVREL